MNRALTGALGAGLAILAAACGSGTPQNGTTIGVPVTVERKCAMDKLDGGAFTYGVPAGEPLVKIELVNNKCPYAIRVAQATLTPAFTMRRVYPAGNAGGFIRTDVYNAGRIFLTTNTSSFQNEFGCAISSNCVKATVTFQYLGGTAFARDGKPRDSVTFAWNVGPAVPGRTTGNEAQGYAILPGEINPAAHVVSAFGAPLLSRALSFQNTTAIDTGHFTYAWEVDGQPVPNLTGAFLTTQFDVPGNHSVVSRATYADGAVISASSSVNVGLFPDISGTAVAFTGTSYTWNTAADPGGTGPYTYAWSVNYMVVGSGESFAYTFNDAGSTMIRLQVTDANGRVGYATFPLTVYDANCGPNCNPVRAVKPRATSKTAP